MRDGFRSTRRGLLALVFFDSRIDQRAAIQAFPGIADQEIVRETLHDHQSIAFGTVHKECPLGASTGIET